MKTLIGLNSSDTSNGFLDSLLVFWFLLKHGEVLHQVLSKWIVRVRPSIVVKFAPGLDISESQTMCPVWFGRQTVQFTAEKRGLDNMGASESLAKR